MLLIESISHSECVFSKGVGAVLKLPPPQHLVSSFSVSGAGDFKLAPFPLIFSYILTSENTYLLFFDKSIFLGHKNYFI